MALRLMSRPSVEGLSSPVDHGRVLGWPSAGFVPDNGLHRPLVGNAMENQPAGRDPSMTLSRFGGLLVAALLAPGSVASGTSHCPTDPVAEAAPAVDWHDCVISTVDLSLKDLSGANLTDATLTAVDLRIADLTGADLDGITMSGSLLNFATLVDASIVGANIASSNFSDANLSGADLTNTTFTSPNFARVDLTGATLTGMSAHSLFDGADMTGATGIPASLTGSFDGVTCPDGFVAPPRMTVKGTSYRRSHLQARSKRNTV